MTKARAVPTRLEHKSLEGRLCGIVGSNSRGTDKLRDRDEKDEDPGRSGRPPGRQDHIASRIEVGGKELDQRWQGEGRKHSIYVCSDGQGQAGLSHGGRGKGREEP